MPNLELFLITCREILNSTVSKFSSGSSRILITSTKMSLTLNNLLTNSFYSAKFVILLELLYNYQSVLLLIFAKLLFDCIITLGRIFLPL